MTLHGATVPTDHGEFVVTVICPNSYSHQRLMQAINAIVPEAAEPVDIADAYRAGPPSCSTGGCGDD